MAADASSRRTDVHLHAASRTFVPVARPKAETHRPPPMTDLARLDPEVALPLLRSATWHPETVGPMLRHIADWLHDTGQRTAAALLVHPGFCAG